MLRGMSARLGKLEGSKTELSERAKAWLGLRQPLTAEELAVEPPREPADDSGWSPALRKWLGV